jgi:hypothetical protein
MGSLRATCVLLVCALAAVAQSRRVADRAVKVNLDAIARAEAINRNRSTPRLIHKPVPAEGRLATRSIAPAVLPAEAPQTEQAYTVYTGFPALLDTYRTSVPDTVGAVGPNHVVTMLNAQVLIQSRNGEIRAGYPIDLNRFWSALGDFTDTFDPRILYDPEKDRWLASSGLKAGTDKSGLLVGVSATGDPAGDWNIFLIDFAATGEWADYPVLGFNATWVVLCANVFRLPPKASYDRTDIYVFRKSGLYEQAGGDYLVFSDTEGQFSPVRDYDNRHPDMFYLVQTVLKDGGTIRISELTGPPGSEHFAAGVAEIPAGQTWAPAAPFAFDFAPQFASWAKIDTGDSRLQNCIERRGSIWCTHTVFVPADKPTRAAVQWFEVDPDARRLLQLGRIDDPTGAAFYAFPSIAVNRDNDAVVGFTRFTKTGYPDAAFALRTVNDPPNAVGSLTVFKRGEAAFVGLGYSGGSNRWGDYSATVVDPVDDLAFWTIQEYASTPTRGYLGRWGTWWARILPPAAAPNCHYVVAAPSRIFTSQGGTAVFSVTTEPGCPWMATSNAAWLTVDTGSGTGSGTVAYSIAPNDARFDLTGAITIAGLAVEVTVGGKR